VYVTCSILPQENDRVACRFLAATPDAYKSAIPADWGRPAEVGRQILPGESDMDGFFFARFCKR
jgi:16S rRNA (cytosine967-C5)-methyltransferase